MVKPGSKWTGTQGAEFVVITTAEINGVVWVHYRKAHTGGDVALEEYSCFLESFQQRFRPLPD